MCGGGREHTSGSHISLLHENTLAFSEKRLELCTQDRGEKNSFSLAMPEREAPPSIKHGAPTEALSGGTL